MAARCVTVPTYTTNTVRDHQHILGNSGARAVIVSSQKLAKTLILAVLFSTWNANHIILYPMRRCSNARRRAIPPLGRVGG
jgi:long-chain acyl-CoA synthetase